MRPPRRRFLIGSIEVRFITFFPDFWGRIGIIMLTLRKNKVIRVRSTWMKWPVWRRPGRKSLAWESYSPLRTLRWCSFTYVYFETLVSVQGVGNGL
jgi:hypothetical protein